MLLELRFLKQAINFARNRRILKSWTITLKKGSFDIFSSSHDSVWVDFKRFESIPMAGPESKPHDIPWPRRDTDLTQLIWSNSLLEFLFARKNVALKKVFMFYIRMKKRRRNVKHLTRKYTTLRNSGKFVFRQRPEIATFFCYVYS